MIKGVNQKLRKKEWDQFYKNNSRREIKLRMNN